MADHTLNGLPAKPERLQSMKDVSSQTKRDPMLLFEFEAALFQFEQREPEFEPLFQLPPNSAEFLPSLPLWFLALYPCANHCSHLCNQHLDCLLLVQRDASNRHKKTHPKPQVRDLRVCGINL